jgi:MFS family permease
MSGTADSFSRPIWREAGFGLLWGARTVSLLGDRITILAVPFAAVAMEATPLQVATLTAASFLPWLLLGAFAGVAIDRSARYQTIMIWADLGRAVLLSSVPAAALGGVLTYWQLLVVALLAGALSVFFESASSAYLPILIGPERLPDGNAKLSASTAVMTTAGPGVAGLLIQCITARFAIAVDALTFLISAILLNRIHDPGSRRPEKLASQSFSADVRAGLRYITHHSMLRAFVAEAATSNLGASMNGAIVVLFAVRVLHLSAGEFGLAGMFFGIGGGAASLLSNRVARWFGVGPVITGSCVVIGIAGLLIGLTTGGIGVMLAVLAVAYFMWGAGLTAYVVIAGSLRQVITPERMRARVMATANMAISGLNPVGAILGGLLATWVGLRSAVLTASVLMLVSVLWVAFSPVARIRTMPSAADEAAEPQQSARAGLAREDESVLR